MEIFIKKLNPFGRGFTLVECVTDETFLRQKNNI